MKKLLSVFLAFFLMIGLLPSFAAPVLAASEVASGTCGADGDGSSLTWTLDSDGVLTVSGSGAMKDYSLRNQPWSNWRDQITAVVIAPDVTTVGTNAFCNCAALETVTMANSVSNIGSSAFAVCSSLTTVSIPSSVSSIGDNAFVLCTALEEMPFTRIMRIMSISISRASRFQTQ